MKLTSQDFACVVVAVVVVSGVLAYRFVCVRDRQRCSGPFSYITVEMGFFKAFPTFLSDGWMCPGSGEQCCMCCSSCLLVYPVTRYLHICVLSYHTRPGLFKPFLSAPSVLYI